MQKSAEPQMLDKDYFKCTCKKDKICKNCRDWNEYTELDDNEWWDGS